MSDHEPAARPESSWISIRPGTLSVVVAAVSGAAAVAALLDGARWEVPTLYGLMAAIWILRAFGNQVLVDRDGVVVRRAWGRRYYPAVGLTEQVTTRHVLIRQPGQRREVLRLPRNPSRWKLRDVHVTPSHIGDPTGTIRALLAGVRSHADADRQRSDPRQR